MPLRERAGCSQRRHGIRFVAIVVDGIIVGIVTGIVAAILRVDLNGRSSLQTLLGLFYYVYFWSSASMWPGQTIDSRIFNIRVIKTDGSDLDIGSAVIRYVGFIISTIAS